jgi:hypothetical protein
MKMGRSGIAALAMMSATPPILFDPGPTDRTPYPWELEPKVDPKPDSHKDLSKKQRKVYSKVLIETGDRDKAYEAACRSCDL